MAKEQEDKSKNYINVNYNGIHANCLVFYWSVTAPLDQFIKTLIILLLIVVYLHNLIELYILVQVSYKN